MSLLVIELEDRLTPSIPLATEYALGEDTRTFGSAVYAELTIRIRTGDPSLVSPFVRGLSTTDTMQFEFGLNSTFSGGVHAARADFDGDGEYDLVVASPVGIANLVRIYPAATGTPPGFSVLLGTPVEIAPFETTFTGGVNIATGDVTGDGRPDIIVSPDEGGGPRIDIYDGVTLTKVASFFGIDDAAFRGGARTAVGDFNNDGFGDLAVAAGFGGGPRVAVFDGKSLTSAAPVRLFNDFFVFESTLRNGATIAAGDLNGDGFEEIIAGGGPGGGPRIFAVSGKALLTSGGADLVPLANFFAGNPNDRSGVRLVAKNLDGDGIADLIVAEGPSGDRNQPNRSLAFYLGTQLVSADPPTLLTGVEFGSFPFSTFADGYWVG